MIAIRLEPLDSWFFRGGTPFAGGAAPQEHVESLFPPHPATVIGAVRMALALARGWDGRGRWPIEFNPTLGDGPEDLGRLSFEGPFLLRGRQPLFRAPRHLLGDSRKNEWRPTVLLRPGPPVLCDLGERVRLPQNPEENQTDAKLRTGDREWLTLDGLNAVLQGRIPNPSTVVRNEDLWSVEERIGLERDRDTRSAKEGMLYSTHHVRPKADISLGMRIHGLPETWTAPFGQLVPLGGESRLAECREWKDAPEIDKLGAGTVSAEQGITLVTLSPLDLEPALIRGERPLDALGGARIVSACLDRPQRIGGWDSLQRQPLPLCSALAPGSVFFCEARQEPGQAVASGNGLLRIGARKTRGFGLVACGRWPQQSGDRT